ncbi:MAG: DNA polymerase I [Cyanophyceae cyanobacterium]
MTAPKPVPASAAQTETDRPTLLLVDGHSLAFRSYYAFANSREGGLRTSTGLPTSACYGFTKALLDTIAAEHPAAIAVAFDLRQPTFRHEADATYKDGRAETPVDFIADLELLQELLAALALPLVMVPGYEADDAIGALAEQGAARGYGVKILSGDRDLFQLVDDERQICVLHLGGRDLKSSRYGEYRSAQVIEKWGVRPDQVVDFKALCGDKSDNIPGVKGVGEKTAAELLQKYDSLDGIYGNLFDLKPAVRKKLEADREAAYHSQFLARIVRDTPIAVDWDACRLTGFDRDRVAPVLQKLEFQQFLRQIDRLQEEFGGPVSTDSTNTKKSTDRKANTETTRDAVESAAAIDGDLEFFSAEATDSAIAARQSPDDFHLEIITTIAQLETLIAALEQCRDRDRPVAWDTETTALNPHIAAIVGIGCCYQPPDAIAPTVAYIPLGHQDGPNLDRDRALELLRPILESADHPKVLQNAKFDRAIFRSVGIDLAGVVFDPMLASYVLNPDGSHNQTDLSFRYLHLNVTSYGDLVPKGQTIADVPVEAVAEYCGMDAYGAFKLVEPLRAELAQFPELEQLFQTIELPLEPVLAAMEWRGIRIDTAYLENFSKQLERDLDHLEKQAHEAAGETFNLASPKQLSELLFERLGLDRKKSRKIKTGYSTDAATLEKLRDDHPVVAAIVEHRTLAKLKSTYVDALPALVEPTTGRVHTDFNQAVTATGRLSSSNPNLQNIPIRTAFSRQIRRAFLPEEGWLLASADYSQIELRILAHLSGEPTLIEAYRTGEDVHGLTAKLLLEKDTVSSDERRLGKIINFGIIYGMGASRFAREAGVPLPDARGFIQRFNDRYPQVFDYLQQVQRQAIAQGYVTTLTGRRRYFNFTSAPLQKLRGKDPNGIDLDRIKSPGQYDAQLLRAAANAPIQGSSADIIKIAMVKLADVLKAYRSRLLLQVHDELIFEVPPEEWDAVRSPIADTMATAVELAVPLAVDLHAGANWMEAK